MLKYDLMYEDKKIGSIEEGKMNIVDKNKENYSSISNLKIS